MNIQEKIKAKLGSKVLDCKETSPRRKYLLIKKEDIFDSVKFLFKDLGLRFSTASGMQTAQGFEILYHFCDDKSGEIYSLRVLIEDKIKPEIDSITPIFSGAEWIEREMWELLGINFKGHPNLKKLLLADDWPDGNYPLRKKE